VCLLKVGQRRTKEGFRRRDLRSTVKVHSAAEGFEGLILRRPRADSV
jgi:hypothetical protein